VIDDDYVVHREANAYLAALRARDRSANTERVYAGRIALYLSYCSATGLDWKTPSVEALSEFLRHLVKEPLPSRGRSTTTPRYRSKGTANAIMTVVCELLRFGAAHKWVPMEVALAVSEPKFLTHLPPGFDIGERGQFRRIQAKTIKFAVPRGGYKWLTDDQLTQLVSTPTNARDRFLITLMAVTGVRIGEALGLRREDMHFMARSDTLGCQLQGPHIHVRRRANVNGALAKSRYPRTVPVPDDVVDLYADYQHERGRSGADASDMVFVTSIASLRTDLALARSESARLRADNDKLRRNAQRLLGQQLDQHDSGELLARVDSLVAENRGLNDKLLQSTQHRVGLQKQITELEEDIAAARTALRRMIKEKSSV